MQKNSSLEFWRAVFHVGVLMVVLAVASFLPNWLSKSMAASTMMLIIAFEVLRLYNERFGDFAHKFFSWGFRDAERGRHGSLFDGAIGVTLVFFFFPYEVFKISLLLAAFPDPAARFVGRRFGQVKIPYTEGKTVLGSLSFFFVACVIVVQFCPILTAIVVAVVSTMLEAYSRREYHLDDNFTIPIFSALLLWALR